MNKYVVGDIHGSYKALIQVLEKCKFKKGEDLLIVLGDLTDRKPQSKEVLDFLYDLKKSNSLIGVRGNHDDWALIGLKWACGWIKTQDLTPDEHGAISFWLKHGGDDTIDSYKKDFSNILNHLELLNSLKPFLEIDNNLFVHGGFDLNFPIENQKGEDLNWDRSLFLDAFNLEKKHLEKLGNLKYSNIFIGHTPTIFYDSFIPIQIKSSKVSLINMDTGAAYEGKLSLMNIETLELFQSDYSHKLYY